MDAPAYLRDFTVPTQEKQSRFRATVQARCRCGCMMFNISVHRQTIPLGYTQSIRDPADGQVYVVKRGLFGKVRGRIKASDLDDRVAVRIRCRDCGAEYVAFDNYRHGYDAAAFNEADRASELPPDAFSAVDDSYHEVFVRTTQDMTYEELKEDSDFPYTYDEYTNAFSFIEIFIKDKKGKNKTVFCEETA